MNDGKARFHIMTKPTGSICNLNCRYCYYLHKQQLFDKSDNYRMKDFILERYIRQYISSHVDSNINFTWQGGEPTLLGVDYFKKIIHYQKIYCPPTKIIHNDLQTNGTLLDKEWCEFLRENRILVGLSVDGPEHLHDEFRRDKQQQPTLGRVVTAAKLMKEHGVEFNTLTVVNRINAKYPLEVYRFSRDELGSSYLQFLPCVEPKDFTTVAPGQWDRSKLPHFGESGTHPGTVDSVVTDWSVEAEDYGDFLCAIFDEWVRNDVGEMFVRIFDVALGVWMGMEASACYFAETCGKDMAMEHDGSVYSCDHYVYPENKLGNIKDKSLTDMLCMPQQMKFGADKAESLPQYCKDCEVRFICNGECPKNRFVFTPEGEFGLNYLCTGLRKFFKHIDPWMKLMANELRAGRTAENVMKTANQPEQKQQESSLSWMRTGLNSKCPCGSRKKYRKCCYPEDKKAAQP